jgi:hypothetical protein
MRRRIAVVGVTVVVVALALALGHEVLSHGVLPPVADATWTDECGGCHVAYHPALLPARSWRALMAELPAHFGEELALDQATAAKIAAFLVANAGDSSTHRRARELAAGTRAEETPRRVSETYWFKSKHGELAASVWARKSVGGRGNCPACHLQAASGDFEGRRAVVPE